MARNRKGKANSPKKTSPDIDIPEDEQWRLVQESGILHKFTPETGAPTQDSKDSDEAVSPLAEELFSAAVLVIPFTFFYILMDILIHQQYAKQPTAGELAGRAVNSMPILSVFVFYTNRHKHDRRVQFLLFFLSILVGPRMIWLINRGSWLVNMKQCPPYATIWLYTVVQMNLWLAMSSLAVIYGWVCWAGMKLVL